VSDDLPGGWAAVEFGQVVESMKNGLYKPASSYADRGVACLRMYNIENGGISWHNIKRMKLSPTEGREYELAPGDLLVNRVNSRELVGKAAVIPEGLEHCVFESKNIRVRLHSSAIEPRYANYALSLWGREHFTINSQQVVGMASISQPQIAAFRFPLAPLAEQRRIVEKVEALLEQVNRAKGRLDRVPLILKRFRQAVLAAGCAGELTSEWRGTQRVESMADHLRGVALQDSAAARRLARRSTVGLTEVSPPEDLPETWCIRSVKELVTRGAIIDFQDGNHGSLYPRATDFGEMGVRFLTAKQVFNDRVLLDEAPFLRAETARTLRIGHARPGDVLLTHNATVGRVGVLPVDAPPCILGTSVTYYRLNPAVLDSRFVAYLMQSELWQSQLRTVMEQTTRNQVSVRKQAEFWLVLPPPEEQREIARRIDDVFRLANAVEGRITTAIDRTENLTQAVLATAFAGELVPTEAELARAEGRSYETAEELLARVRSINDRDDARRPGRRARTGANRRRTAARVPAR